MSAMHKLQHAVPRHNHTEVDVRYAWLARESRAKHARGSAPLLWRVRLRELERLFQRRYGALLPYDDAGIDDLTVMANHIAQGPGGFAHIIAWARHWMPDMPEAEAAALAKRVIAKPQRFKAATLGWRMRLTDGERTALNITTIRAFDVTPEQMAERRKGQQRERMARLRLKRRKGALPKPEPLGKTKPWTAFGMSRATWYRRGKPMPETVETTPRAQQVVTVSMLRTASVSPAERQFLVEGMASCFRTDTKPSKTEEEHRLSQRAPAVVKPEPRGADVVAPRPRQAR